MNKLIYIAIGGNLVAPGFNDLRSGLDAAIALLAGSGLQFIARAPWYRSPPWPPSDQPWYLNSVIAARTSRTPNQLLNDLLEMEKQFGRIRTSANAARPLDLDLLDYAGMISPPDSVPILPHPRLQQRSFVLWPLADIAPDWRHPISGKSALALRDALPADQIILLAEP